MWWIFLQLLEHWRVVGVVNGGQCHKQDILDCDFSATWNNQPHHFSWHNFFRNGCRFPKNWGKVKGRVFFIFFCMTFTTHTATGITPSMRENIITGKNGLLMGSHSTVVVCGVNKQKLRLRAAVLSLRGTISVMWREDGWMKLASCHLSLVSVTSTCVSHCIFVVRLISTAQVVRGSTLTSARAVATFWTDSAQNHDYYKRFQWFLSVSARWCGAVSEAFTPLVKKKKIKNHFYEMLHYFIAWKESRLTTVPLSIVRKITE